MPSFDRNRLTLTLFHDGLPEDLTSAIGLDSQPWLFLNTPTEMLTAEPSVDQPDTIDLIGGRLMPRPGADLASCKRSAQFHFGRSGQEVQRRRMATELALGRGLLEPDLTSMFCVQFLLPCERREARHLARSLADLGFARVVIIVGSDSTETSDPGDGYTVVRSHVVDDDDSVRLIVDGASQGIVPLHDREASARLRSRLAHLIETMHTPRRLPVVVDIGTHDADG